MQPQASPLFELLGRDNSRLEDEIAAYGAHGASPEASDDQRGVSSGADDDRDLAGRQLAAVQQLLQRQEEENARLEAQLAAPEKQRRPSRALPAASSSAQRPASPRTIAALEAEVAALEEQLVATARNNAAEAMDLEMQLFEAQMETATLAGSERASLAPRPQRENSGPLAGDGDAGASGAGGRRVSLGAQPLPAVSTPLARARPSLPRARAPPSPVHPRTGSPRRPDSGVRLAPLGGGGGGADSMA